MGRLVEGKWTHEGNGSEEGGHFVREASAFRDRITSSGRPVEAGRYHLYVSLACPWAQRTLIVHKLKKLEDAISLTIVDPISGEEGWVYSDGPESETQTRALWEIYAEAKADYTGRVTVPVLWDKKDKTIVNNESREIVRIFDTELDELGDPELTLYPESLRPLIDRSIDLLYEPINNGIYRAGLATTQEAYDEAVTQLFEALDYWEEVLDEQRFVAGEVFTEADICLFVTLYRFDSVYHGLFKCNLRRIADYPNLSAYVRDIYQNVPGVRETCDLGQIKQHYYRSFLLLNPSGIVPKGPLLDFDAPQDREDRARRFGASSSVFARPATKASPEPEETSLASPSAAPEGELEVELEREPEGAPAAGEAEAKKGPLPTISQIVPSRGPATRATSVTVSGTAFAEGCVAKVGDTAVSATRESENSLRLELGPSDSSGYLDLRVENPDGQSALAVRGFFFEPPPRIQSADPTSVSVLGGTRLTLLGADFAEGCVVSMGGIELETRRIDSTHLEATTLARPAGESDIVVQNPDGQSATRESAIRFVEPPVITKLEPESGLLTGGGRLHIHGRHFASGMIVVIGTTSVSEVELVNENELTLEIPPFHAHPSAPGPVDVRVVTPLGLSHHRPLAFSYRSPPPRIESVSPNVGPSAGNTLVRIRGSFFQKGSVVYVCGIEAPIQELDREELVITTPAVSRSGPVDIRVVGPDDQVCVAEGVFRYEAELPPPVLESLHPRGGAQTGGLKVRLYGQDFAEGCQVSFGGVPAAGLKFLTNKELEVQSPAFSGSGAVDVVVDNPDGKSSSLASAFSYEAVPPPVIRSIQPSSGPTTGGTRIVIEGEHFTRDSRVYIGREYPKDLAVRSANEIVVLTAPRKMAGVVDVEVSVPGLAKAVLKNGFRFDAVPAPVISGVSPNRGGTDGGTELSITGQNFLKDSVVLVGGKEVKSAKLVDKTTLEIKTPPGKDGAMVDVVVRNPDGREAVQKRAFMYDARYG